MYIIRWKDLHLQESSIEETYTRVQHLTNIINSLQLDVVSRDSLPIDAHVTTTSSCASPDNYQTDDSTG